MRACVHRAVIGAAGVGPDRIQESAIAKCGWFLPVGSRRQRIVQREQRRGGMRVELPDRIGPAAEDIELDAHGLVQLITTDFPA